LLKIIPPFSRGLLIFIKSIDKDLLKWILKFADDIKLLSQVNNVAQCDSMQRAMLTCYSNRQINPREDQAL